MTENTITNLVGTIFAQGLLALRQNCVMPRLVNSDYTTSAAERGDAITITIPSAASAVAISPANVSPDPPAQVPTKATISLSNWYECAFQLTDKQIAEIGVPNYRSMVISEQVRVLAETINASIFDVYPGVYGYVGTAGTTPFATDVAAATQARKVLGRQRAPLAPRACVLGPDAEANALGLRAFQDASFRGDAAGIVDGQIGRKLGFTFAMDQQIPTHTSGTITTGLIAKASTAVAAGLKTFVGTTAASTGACDLEIGDVIAISGHTTTYTLTDTATQASAASDVTLKIEPGLEIALAGSETITVKASHVVNLAFQRDAIGFASRTLAGGADMTAEERANVMELADPVSGVTLRLERRREHYRTRWSFSCLWGVALIRPECAVRIAG